MSKWVIVKLSPGSVQMLNKIRTGFTDDIKDALIFNDKATALSVSEGLAISTLVHQLQDDALDDQLQLPSPDFFEYTPDLMDLKDLIEMIRSPDLLEFFNPVESITGGRQMTGGGIADAFTGRITGRYYRFSFDQCLSDSDAARLNDIARTSGEWDSVDYSRIRLGFTEYAMLTLKAKVG